MAAPAATNQAHTTASIPLPSSAAATGWLRRREQDMQPAALSHKQSQGNQDR